MSTYSYTKDVSKWGDLVLAILKKDELVKLFEAEGIFRDELEQISTTEERAEIADLHQRDATQSLSELTPKITAMLDALLELFDKLRLRLPNVIDDLQRAKDETNAKAASDLDFSHKAAPRVPRVEGPSEARTSDGELETLETEESKETEEAPERRSKAQRAVSMAAKRLATYLSTKPELVAALQKRKMPDTFVEDLMSMGIELGELRELRMLALSKQKEATKVKYQAVEEHMTARKKVEPTASKLSRSNRMLDALLVEYLGRKSLHTNQEAKRTSAQQTEAKKT